jgi:hypothetical protein
MAIVAMFEVTGATSAKYDEVIRRLTAMGAKLDAFGAKLVPILQEMDIEAKPTVFDIYNIIEGT